MLLKHTRVIFQEHFNHHTIVFSRKSITSAEFYTHTHTHTPNMGRLEPKISHNVHIRESCIIENISLLIPQAQNERLGAQGRTKKRDSILQSGKLKNSEGK